MRKRVIYEAPSNIALVKYWGKYGDQMPCNASISLTLSQCRSIFDVELSEKTGPDSKINLEFQGKKNTAFIPRIEGLFSKIGSEYPIVSEFDWTIKSENSFPHSSGIASSASSMAALALCIEDLQHGAINMNRVSRLARLGSGSASRSVIEKVGWWGEHPYMPMSHQEWAIPAWEDIDEVFMDFRDTILIASSGEKSVGSSLGHDLMKKSIYSHKRFEDANQNIVLLYGAMREGDLEKFGEIVEYEAMSLHALMMMSKPSYILLKPNTLAMIEKIISFRNETKLPVCFTLDAGPNIHLLYPNRYGEKMEGFIEHELKVLCENNLYIKDHVGKGPIKKA